MALQSREQMKLESSDSEGGFSDIDSEMKEKLNWNDRGRSKSPDVDDILGDFDAIYQKALEDKKKEETSGGKKNKNFSRSFLNKKSSTDNV